MGFMALHSIAALAKPPQEGVLVSHTPDKMGTSLLNFVVIPDRRKESHPGRDPNWFALLRQTLAVDVAGSD